MKNKEKKLEENLLEMVKLKEEKDKQLLMLEWVIGYISSVTFLVLLFVASFIPMQSYLSILLIVVGFLIFGVGMGYGIKIEQIAGYYECGCCGHKYIPKYKSVFWAMHIGRTRYMKCPKCGMKSWNKKVLTK